MLPINHPVANYATKYEGTTLPSLLRHPSFSHSTRLASRSSSMSSNTTNQEVSRPFLFDEKINSPNRVLRNESSHDHLANGRSLLPISNTPEETPSRTKVIGTVLFYLVAAIVMVFSNKWVLNATSIPLTFLFFQLIMAVILLQLCALTGHLKIPTFSWSTTYSLLPLILINVSGLVFNTFCLQYVDASFYQVARGLILPFTVLASYLFLDSKPSPNTLSAVLVVCVGFFWGVKSEQLTASSIGILLGVFSSLTTSVHAIVVKKSLSITSSPIELSYYNNLLSAVLLIPIICTTSEVNTFVSLIQSGGDNLRTFIIGALVTGLFGFLICLAGFLSIKVTSPVTHMVSSAVRGVIQTFLGIFLFGEVVSSGRWIGIIFILVGSAFYTFVKEAEQRGGLVQRPVRERKESIGMKETIVHLPVYSSTTPVKTHHQIVHQISQSNHTPTRLPALRNTSGSNNNSPSCDRNGVYSLEVEKYNQEILLKKSLV
ncbi:uncharacterized protein MELLADRAFT_49361 [Melampsora larici-populina 98AG31]|uniref:Sugar phosphate transporter domain-containing protein n=1 Tax=Melampsora larici-populina (strain 98AG31 / pathotype 3-4-7) TaxID=747676 RepID=F4RUQ2_MELLP|nr:uncharacterized protein MELLADRAFT_49361 [Melampsora larici-populina 98AG31]EGG03735.1 hypothetical protein MELLADRAFT_49361 [Melampsora larici-populina 98AG31]